ncbi:serine/threonine-protein kinase [[Mycobacterium] kokjensenii]|uniref:non-specific serine/threonine protein kinase n=2 Tax=Mycobacteriaceae TaxID=1762 RepID=A0A1X2EQW1_9MYCO|nr:MULTISPECIES: serine/threonine-protein kinase [Mycobacteriaceae]ORX08537.1 hypothetical protein AWC30_01645 [Mycolicibacillus trivialis]CAJ1506368.1 serine/threonine-protein kinase [Mycolicibacter sp. MU0083]
MPLRIGETFAGYRILRLLGSGGMGEVYLVQHPRLPRRDALKVLPSSLTTNEEFRQRFVREAELVATLFHPNIVGMHDRGECDGQLWMSMDYVDGPDTAKLVRERYPAGLPLDEAIAVAIAVADALDHAHERGLLHRDVKPANILLGQTDSGGQQRIFLADFGIARPLADPSGLTGTNLTVGTVSYAAPEQLAGEELDARADQYALAASIFHLLAGVPPFDKSNPVAVISAHLNAPPPQISRLRPELARLDEVFSTALAKDPAQRFGSCREFAAALTGHASAEGEFGAAKTQQAMPTASRGGVSEGGRNRLVGKTSAIAAVAVVAVVAAGVVGYTMTRDSSHTPVPGERPGSLNQPANQGQLEGTQATARSAAEALKASIPEITKIVDVDEDNDPNEGMMGRPNGYVAASVVYDSRLACSELGMECGATIEQWPDQAAAQRRSAYLQAVRQGGILGREWNTIRGPLLLRVAGDMKPSEAKEYETAFLSGGTGSAPAAAPQRVSKPENPAIGTVGSGFGQDGKSVIGIVIATTDNLGAVGQFATTSINFLDHAGNIIDTKEQVERFSWPGQQLVLPTAVFLEDPETTVASIESSISISDYSDRRKARPELPMLNAESITKNATGKWTPVFTFTNSTAEDLVDLRIGVVCYDATGSIIGGGSEYPKLVAAGKSIRIEPNRIVTSGEPTSCKALLNYGL